MIITCKKNDPDPGPPGTLLTFTTDPRTSFTSTTDDWVFVTDEAGTVLDNKPFEAGQTVVLTGPVPSGKVNVTVLKYTNTYTYITSYLSIPIGQTWAYLPFTPDSAPQIAGTANLTITNFPATSTLGDLTFSDENGLSYASAANLTAPGTYAVQIALAKIPARIYVATFRNSAPVALAWNNVINGAALTGNFNTDFKPLDHSVTLNFSGSNTIFARVTGLTGNGKPSSNNGNVMYLRNYMTVNGPLTVGYNDGFDTYKTDVGIVTGPGAIFRTYAKIGAVPTSAPFLNYTLSVAKDDVRDFIFTLSGNFHVRHSIWNSFSTTQLEWHVYAPPEGKQKFPNLPPEIKAKYPSIKPELFEYNSNIFTLYLDGFTYDDYIKQGISGPWTKFSGESQTIQIK
jgi:hypothetical protein